ncbi:MAG: ATP-binding cassette domain-containing protein [Firmicutes bacterium]|nr:ATP-binding cassette domain-containing protein [Bacillota bacterium]
MHQNQNQIVLKTHQISKDYKGKLAVEGVSLQVNKGDIYGLVGLNGSGKTTLIRLITSLITPTSGSFSLFDGVGSSMANLTRISSMIEKPAIYENLSAKDNLLTQCRIAGVEKAEMQKTSRNLLEMVGLADVGGKKAGAFSLGMRQRLGIAMALVGSPELMLLDEPTNGLDPAGIIQIRELLVRLNRELGITMFICSHILTELSKIATRYGFIHKGKLIQEVEAEELESKSEGIELERYFMELIYKYDTAMASQPYYAVHNYNGGIR